MMSGRKLYIVCYDIREPKRLRRVYKVMLGYGDPLQYSVFVCELSEVERVLMEMRLREVANVGEDSIAIVDLGRVSRSVRRRVRVLGKAPHIDKDVALVV